MIQPGQLEQHALAPKRLRLLGFIIDSAVFAAMQLMGSYVGGILAATIIQGRGAPEWAISESTESGMIFGWVFWGAVALLLNYGVLQARTGGSLGKLICGTRVMRLDGTPPSVKYSLLRWFCYWLSAIPLGYGFLYIFKSPSCQCWHDRLLKTCVILKKAKVARFDLLKHEEIPGSEDYNEEDGRAA